MASILRPVERRAKPPLGTPIDRSEPLARRLVFACLCVGSQRPVDFVSGQTATILGTSPTVVYGSEGAALAGSNAAWRFEAPTGLDRITGPGTIFAIGTVVNATTIQSLLNSGESGAGNGVGFRWDDALLVTNGFFLYGNNTNVTACASDALGTNSEQRFHRVAITWDGTNTRFYVNGRLNNTVANAFLPTAQVNRRTRLNTQWGESVAAASPMVAFYAWDRVLTANELVEIALEPYAIFQPITPRVFFNAAAPTSVTENPAAGSLSIVGIASSINVQQPKGAFSHTYVNAGFWPSRRYGSFGGRAGAVDFPITPARASLGFTGIASPVSQGLIIAPTMGLLAITGFAPVDVIATIIAPTLGSAGFTGISSTLLVENIIRGPPVTALAMTGIIPTVSQGVIISPPQGSVGATGILAGISRSITPTTGSLVTTGFFISSAGTIFPSAGNASFTGNAPSLKFELFLTPPVGALNASGIAAGLSRSITPPLGNLAAVGIASTTIQGAVIIPPAGSGSLTITSPSLLLGSVDIPPQGLLGLSGFGPLIQLVTFVPQGVLSFTGNNASVSSGTFQTQRTQLGPLFIPAKRYKLQGFANKFGTQQALIPAAAVALSGYAPTIIKSYVPALAPLALTGYAPSVDISTTGDRFVTPPAGALSTTGQAPNAIRGSTKKTQLSSRFIPGRRYGRFDSKAGVNINIAPTCGGGIRINYLVDGFGNYIIDGGGNYILSYDDQPGTTAIFNSFLPVVQVSVLAGINISPSRGSLTVTSAAPTDKIEQFITPPKGDLIATGNAPTSSVGLIVTPTTGSLTATGAGPNAGISYVLTPPRGSIQATGTLSTVFIGAGTGIIESPSNGVLGATGFQPVTKTAAIVPQGQLALGGLAPIVSISIVIVPPRAQVFALGQFPIPARSTVVIPPAGSLSQSSGVPLQSIVTFVPAAQLGVSGYPPFVTTETGLRITSGILTSSGFPPGQATTWSASAGQASFTGYPPQIPKVFIPAAGQLGSTGFVSLFKQPEVILIEIKGAAVGTLTLQGKLIGSTQLSGNAIATVVIKPKE